jgi:hypothetical protein
MESGQLSIVEFRIISIDIGSAAGRDFIKQV